MKRITAQLAALVTVATLAMSGSAAAFTPVPIPTPRAASAVGAHVVLNTPAAFR